MKRPTPTQIAFRLALVAMACWTTAVGLTAFTTRALIRLGVYPSEAVLAATLLGIVTLPAIIVWGLAARRALAFGLSTILGSGLLRLLSETL